MSCRLLVNNISFYAPADHFTDCACTPSLSETFFRIVQALCSHCPYSHVTYLGLCLLNNVISSCHKSGVNWANMLSHSQDHMLGVHCQSLSNQFRWQHIYIQMSAENVFTFAYQCSLASICDALVVIMCTDKYFVDIFNTWSTGTVHTSAKASLTSAAIWQISMSSRFMSVNHFPYFPLVTNPENNLCIQTVIQIATKI